MTTKQRWVLVLTSVATFMAALDALVVVTAMSTIHRDLSASLGSLQWIVNAYNLSFAVLLLTGAALGDRLGRRRVFASGLVLFALASAACAVSPTAGTLIAARTVQGVGAALVMPLAMTQLTAAFPPERRGRVLGLFAGVSGLAIFAGPFVGGAISEGLAWQWIFWCNVPIGLLGALLVRARLDETYGPKTRFDLLGNALVTAGALGLVWALVRGNEAGWGSGEVIGSAVAGVLLLAAFVAWERRTDAPMLPMRFFASRAFSAANFAGFALSASTFGVAFLVPQFLQNGLGDDPFEAGLKLMPWTGTLMVCAPIAGALADRIAERWFVVSGLVLQGVSMLWLGSVTSAELSYAGLIVPLMLGGVGISIAMPTVQRAVVGAVALPDIGKASGTYTMFRFLATVFGVAIVTAVFAEQGGFGSPQLVASGAGPALQVAGVIALVGAAGGTLVPARSRRPVAAPLPSDGNLGWASSSVSRQSGARHGT
ncbi:efflux MFS transporter permease [Flindersiella endophytica]